MNITNQINAGLNDIRLVMIAMSETADLQDHIVMVSKIRYISDEITNMIEQHRQGYSVPWSERKGMVEEEFS